MTRLRYNGVKGTLVSSLSSGGTTISFTSALKHAGGTNVPTLSGGDYIPLALIDATTGDLLEIVHLTAYTAGATTGTISRSQESTPAATRPAGTVVVNAPTAEDLLETTGATLSLATNWTGTITYLRRGRTCHVNVVVSKSAAWSNGEDIATLPAGFRPVSDWLFMCGNGSNGAFVVRVLTTGVIEVLAADPGVGFRALNGSVALPLA